MVQTSVNVQDDGEKVTPDLKLVVMEETTKVLEGVQLKVILYVNFIKRERSIEMEGYLIYEKLNLVKCTNTHQPLIQKF
jgi:hypothetical protein